jgi:hypothetical protein
MLADPLVLTTKWTTITPDASRDKTFACIERASDHSLYRFTEATEGTTHDIFVGHQVGRRNRYTVRYNLSGLTPDLIVDGNNSRFSQSVYLVVDVPTSGAIDLGFPGAAITAIEGQIMALASLMIDTDANLPLSIERVIGGET